jgi:uncharacterized membrane-anchored protein
MTTLQRASAGALLCLLASSSLLAQESQEPSAFERIPWQTGPVMGDLGGEAQIQVPEGCLFTGTLGTGQFLELTQNPAAGNERGTIVCNMDTEGIEPWFVVFSYVDMGHVKDDERDKLDADEILESLREGNLEGNKARAERGWGVLTIEGWAKPPYYDQATNNLTWATLVSTGSEGNSVNHSVRLLGREGVINADLVSNEAQFAAVLPTFDQMVGGFSFKTGHEYAAWKEGDRVAEIGLTALVAGGAGVIAAKTGLLAKLWKGIVALGVAAIAAIKKLFGKKTPAAETPTQA